MGGYAQLLASQGRHEKEVVPTPAGPSMGRTVGKSEQLHPKQNWVDLGSLYNTSVSKLLQQVLTFLILSQNEGAEPTDR